MSITIVVMIVIVGIAMTVMIETIASGTTATGMIATRRTVVAPGQALRHPAGMSVQGLHAGSTMIAGLAEMNVNPTKGAGMIDVVRTAIASMIGLEGRRRTVMEAPLVVTSHFLGVGDGIGPFEG